MRVSERPTVKPTFFFPYHDVSGVPVLFARLAVYFAAHGADVEVIDYPDGYMSRTLRGRGDVRLVPFKKGVDTHVGPDRLLVMQSILPSTIHRELRPHPDTRLLFWTLHAMNFVQTIVPSRWGRDFQARHLWVTRAAGRTLLRRFARDLASFVAALAEAGSLVFVDGPTYQATCENLGFQIEHPTFVPLPCPVGETNPSRDAVIHTPLAAAWVGRLDDFKVPMLVHTLAGISAFARTRRMPVRFTIVGEGPLRETIRAERFTHEYLSVAYAGTLDARALDRFLERDADILFAMGTSALEGAKCGVPTVLLDVAYGPVPDGYVFKWLFESSEFGLGALIRQQTLRPGNDSLTQILDATISARRELSIVTHRYCLDTHSMESVAERFVSAGDRASFRAADMPARLMRKGAVRRAYEWTRRQRAHVRGSIPDAGKDLPRVGSR
jgi:glycosyltransferase involved in cell wall biosynthesis